MRRRVSTAAAIRKAHEAWWLTPAGQFERARTEFSTKQALGPCADSAVLEYGQEALAIAEKHNLYDGLGQDCAAQMRRALENFKARRGVV